MGVKCSIFLMIYKGSFAAEPLKRCFLPSYRCLLLVHYVTKHKRDTCQLGRAQQQVPRALVYFRVAQQKVLQWLAFADGHGNLVCDALEKEKEIIIKKCIQFKLLHEHTFKHHATLVSFGAQF